MADKKARLGQVNGLAWTQVGGELLKIETTVVPLGVDTNIFKPHTTARDTTVFFNCGKWEVRKGHDILVNCFNEAFCEEDDVELWMMCENPFLGEQNSHWINLYKNSPLGHKIRIIPPCIRGMCTGM